MLREGTWVMEHTGKTLAMRENGMKVPPGGRDKDGNMTVMLLFFRNGQD
jgi:hypothetical protein